MADNKKYYYLKLKDHFFDDDKIFVLESLPDGYLYSNILLKLYLKSLKGNGRLMFNERIPYTSNLLAQITRHPVGVIEKAIDIFKEFELIEVMDNGAIFITDIQNFIGSSSSEADRQREYQRRLKESNGIDSKYITSMEVCKEPNGESNGCEPNMNPCKETNSEPNGYSNSYESYMKPCKETNFDPNKKRKESNMISTPKKEKETEKELQKRLKDKQEEYKKYNKTETEELEPISQSISQSIPQLSQEENNSISLSVQEIQYFIDCWSNLNISDPIRKLNQKQIDKLTENVKRYGEGQDPMDTISYLIDGITDSSYLMGDTEHRFQLLIDWVLKPVNWKKVIDGEYQNWENLKFKEDIL